MRPNLLKNVKRINSLQFYYGDADTLAKIFYDSSSFYRHFFSIVGYHSKDKSIFLLTMSYFVDV